MSHESTASTIGFINLDKKTTRKRSAGKPHAAFDEAGAGNGRYNEPRQFSTLPVRGIEVLHKEFNYMIKRKIKRIKENHIMPTRRSKVFTSATITPDAIRAGDSDEFIIKLEIAEEYTAEKSRIVFDFSCTLGTSCPTRELNEASGYVEAYISNANVKYEIRCWDLDHKYFVDREHPASREAMRMVVLDLSGGLQAGDIIELHWGETLGGFGPGAKVSSVVPRSDYKAKIDVRYFDSHDKGMPDHGRDYIGYSRPIPDDLLRLEYKILPREPRRLRLLRKNDSAILIPYDVFWNVPLVDDISDIADCNEMPEKNKYNAFDFKNKNVSVVPKEISMSESSTMDNVYDGMNIYWGDLHTHSAYSIDCAQRSGMDMTPNDLMEFARYRAGLDFFAVTDHHIPYMEQINCLGKEKWEATLVDIGENHENGKFVVFPGIEFTDDFGDICLVFKSMPEYEQITRSHFRNVSDFYAEFGKKMMAIPHLHVPGISPEGTWRKGIDEISPVLEVYSDHGSYERKEVFENGRAWCKNFRKDRCADYFLKQGYKYGLVANSDDHKGHVGVNGLTGVYAKELTRDALFEAYQKRCVYGTTNARIRLLFTANGKLMGSTISLSSSKEFLIDVTGENTLKKIELFRNGELYKRFIPAGKNFKTEFKVNNNESDNWYVRITQIDNHIAWSSPVWFE